MHPHERRERFAIWGMAAAFAIALHVGGVAVAFANLQEMEDEGLGAQVFEVGLELASPRAETVDLPPGPEAEASVAAPDMIQQEAETQPEDLPRETPTEPEAEEPDRVVTEKEQKPAEEKVADAAPVATQASEAAVASEATAAPAVQAPTQAPNTVTPSRDSGARAAAVRMSWQRQLFIHLERNKRYPEARSGKGALVVVGFELDRRGRVSKAAIVKGSGDAAFDQAALDMLKRADPVPVPPPLVADEGLAFNVPVDFRRRR